VSNVVDGITYESGNWDEIIYDKAKTSLGNHRAVIKVPTKEDVVWLHLPWRRHDTDPGMKRVIIVNPVSGDTIRKKMVRVSTKEYADILFLPQSSSEIYHVYYFPFETSGGNYPVVKYLLPESSGDQEWFKKYEHIDYSHFSKAKVLSIQSINDFNSFFPMEVVANKVEIDSFMEKYPKNYYLFPEFRNHPTRMTRDLPYHWIKRGLKNGIADNVKKGEFYEFQIAVFAAKDSLSNLSLTYTDLHSDSGNSIEKKQFQCVNLFGIDLKGNPFKKKVNVQKHHIQPLWIGINIPEDQPSGEYKGMVILTPTGQQPDTIHLDLMVVDEIIKDHGDDEPAKMSRLRWLNSTLGSEDNFIISPFIPVTIKGLTLKILGREVDLEPTGLPSAIRSYFKEEMTSLQQKPENILASPIQFNIEETDNTEKWTSNRYEIKNQSKGRAKWSVTNESDNFTMLVNGILEYDGMLQYEIAVIAKKEMTVRDMKMLIPMTTDASKYILGLGYKGSSRPGKIDWHWDITKNQEGIWLGNVNKGLQYVLRDNNYQRPLNTNFYQSQPLNLPPSWYNEGKGGIKVSEENGHVLCKNYSGQRKVLKGDTLHFNIRFLITPFKTIDTKAHFNTRFVHKYVPVDSVKKLGGTVVNIHHANEINPYINYPFYHLDLQKKYIDEAHRKGIKVKLYYTIRELSYKCYELFPLRSLGNEIFNDGVGGGHPWLQEHLEADYHKAWHAWRVNDAAILDKGTSRWTNYYIEGLNWLAKNQKIDGLYLDDIAFSRETVKRMVAVLNRQRDEVIIDLHSANQFNPRDGFINSAFLYMDVFPYITRLWFGEYFEYDLDPDYWLTEVSGIPFGLTGEMLQGGGHPYRGMLYGMTTRVYGKYNPHAIWKLFDDFGISDSEMIGYWVNSTPVRTNNPKVPVTVYRKDDAVLLALGSWSGHDEMITLDIDWSQLPFSNPKATTWLVPGMEGLQKARILETNKAFRVKKNRGLFVIIKE